jgi:protein gp37
MKVEWVRDIRAACAAAAVPFFFKQWGGVRKSETGRRLDGRTYNQFPARPQVLPPDDRARATALRQLPVITI